MRVRPFPLETRLRKQVVVVLSDDVVDECTDVVLVLESCGMDYACRLSQDTWLRCTCTSRARLAPARGPILSEACNLTTAHSSSVLLMYNYPHPAAIHAIFNISLQTRIISYQSYLSFRISKPSWIPPISRPPPACPRSLSPAITLSRTPTIFQPSSDSLPLARHSSS